MIRKGIISGPCLNACDYIPLYQITEYNNCMYIVCYAKQEVLLLMKLNNN